MAAIRGKNLGEVKQQNLEAIKLLLYRKAPISRAELAEQLHLTPATITNITAELIARGEVRELAPNDSGRIARSTGRRPIDIDIVADRYTVLGISLARDRTLWCFIDLRGNILERGEFELMSEEYAIMLHQLQGILSQLQMQYSSLWKKLLGIGISIPGIVKSHIGMLKNHGSERMSWCGKPLGSEISSFTSLPVRMDNNVRARSCAVSMFHPELLNGESTFAFCHVALGIACPLVLGNQPFRGEDAAAGEIGKMILVPDSTDAPDFAPPGSLEALASVRAMLAQAQAAMLAGDAPKLLALCSRPEKLTFDLLLEAQRSGEPCARHIIGKAMNYIGIALANIVDIINPHLIFLSGKPFYVSENAAMVEQSIRAHAFLPDDDVLKVVTADLGDYGGALGAAASCIEKYFIRG